MLPASDLAEIISNLAALNLQPNTLTQILAAVLAPLLRSGPELEDLQETPKRPYRRTSRPRGRGGKRQRKYQRHARRDARERALAALQASPGATVTEIAKAAGCSRSTVANAAAELARETRKEARRQSRAPTTRGKTDPQTERRSRAQKFLRDTLVNGPRLATAVEAAAAKAHIDDGPTLAQARADLGIVTSRANTGGVHAVQWSLPG